MIDIKNIAGEVILSVPITQSCERVEELMKADYVQLSWSSDEGTILPVGAYIEYKGEKFSLLEPYTPEQKDELEYEYKPQFQSKVMAWGKTPLFLYTQTESGIRKETDWVLTDNPANFMSYIADALYKELGEQWNFAVSSDLSASATITFSTSDIYSALNSIASAFETEWWVDKEGYTIHLGKCQHGNAIDLEVGVNVKTPSITRNKEGYFTRFYAFGSTRNIEQDYEGANANNIVNKRLTLDPTKYPEGYKDIREGLKEGEIFSKVLIFDDIYPSSKLSISNVRVRLLYSLDDDNNKVQVGTDSNGNPIYDQYAIWYFQIPNFTYNKENVIEGLVPSINFKTGALAGREFEVIYHDKDKEVTTTDGEPFKVLAGDYEICFIEEGTYIIPSVTGLTPTEGDEIVLFNIKMPEEYKQSAYDELEEALYKEIARMNSDLNTYQLQSNAVAFYNDNPNLTLGQKVRYTNGAYSFETRVMKLVTKLDYECEQAITIGNEKIKGNTEQLKEEVVNANTNINFLAALNETTNSLTQAYQRTQKMMMEGFASIKDMWLFDEKDKNTIYSKFNIYSLGYVSAKGANPNTGGNEGGATTLGGLRNVSADADRTYDAAKMLVLEAKSNLWTLKNLSELVGGLDEAELEQYLTSNKYVTEQWLLNNEYATHRDIDARIDALVNGAPAAYDTLKEIADALQGNVNGINDILTALGTKVGRDEFNAAVDSIYDELDTKLDIDTFAELFEKVRLSDGTYAIKAKLGLFSDVFLSTKGANNSGTSSIGGATALYQLNDVAKSVDGVLGATQGALLMYNGDKWQGVSQRDIVPNLDGYATEDLLYRALNSYLPLSGGTISNTTADALTIDRNSTNPTYICFKNNGALLGYIGINTSKEPVVSINGIKKLIHSGNIGEQSVAYATKAGNSDALGGVDRNSILELNYKGSTKISTAGWYRIGKFKRYANGGNACRLYLYSSYTHASNESYIFDITYTYSHKYCITQTAGHFATTHVIPKIRIDSSSSTSTGGTYAYIDVYYGADSANTIYWMSEGCLESYTEATLVEALTGTAIEFETVKGCKSALGFTGDLMGNAESATKLQTARTLWGQSFDGTGDITGKLKLSNGTAGGLGVLDADGNVVNAVTLSSRSELYFGYDAPSKGITTYLRGNTIRLNYGADNTVGFVLNTLGRIGIGTTNPNYKVHVVGEMLLTPEDTGGLFYRVKNDNYELNFGLGSINGNRGIYDRTNSSWLIYRDATTNVLIPKGNLGVGIINPLYKLDVDGATRTTKLIIGDGTIEWDAEHKGFKVTGGLYSTTFISAKGVNENGENTNTFGRLDNWSDYDSTKNDVLSAKLGYELYSTQNSLMGKVSALESKSTNVSFTQAVTNGTQIGTITIDGIDKNIYAPTIPTKLSQFTDDVVSGKYLPLSGGTITSSSVPLTINRTGGITTIAYKADGTTIGALGFNTNGIPIVRSDYQNNSNYYTILHTGNIASQSVASAAKLTTARSIWGQSFDGTADVSGALSDVTTLTASGSATIGSTLYMTGTDSQIGASIVFSRPHSYIVMPTGGGVNIAVDTPSSANTIVRFSSTKNILIGTTTNSGYKLDVSGTFRTTNNAYLNGVLYVGTESSANIILQRTDANYIWAGAQGGSIVMGVTDTGSTGAQNATLWIKGAEITSGTRNNAVALGSTSYRWSNIYSVNGDYSGTIKANKIQIGNGYIEWDDTNKGFKIVGGLYTESYLSAKGANTNGGSSSGGLITSLYRYADLGKTFSDTSNDTFNAYTINKINTDLGSRISVLEGKATNVSFTQSLTSGTLIGVVSIDGVTKNIYAPTIPTSDINKGVTAYNWGNHASVGYAMASALNGYLPLSGGTIDGTLTVVNGHFVAPHLRFSVDGTEKILTPYAAFDNDLSYYDGTSWYRVIHSGNIGSQSVSYAASAGNATALGGKSLSSGNYTFDSVPYIKSDGVMEVGKYIDFHNDNTTGNDYDCRLDIQGAHRNTVHLPTDSGVLALTTSNVASADKLSDNDTYTIWGQTFFVGGKPKSVSGNAAMGVGGMIDIQNTDEINRYDGDLYIQQHGGGTGNGTGGTTTGNVMMCSNGGNVGIGITYTPTYRLQVGGNLNAAVLYQDGQTLDNYYATVSLVDKLVTALQGQIDGLWHRNGFNELSAEHIMADSLAVAMLMSNTIRTSGSASIGTTLYAKDGIWSDGYVSAKGQNTSSDMRLKNVLNEVALCVKDIANAPSVRFAWKNGGGVDVGSSAQYWQGLLPDAVKEHDGWLEMQYANIALLSAIALAKNFETMEERVARLERENKELRTKIDMMERRIA